MTVIEISKIFSACAAEWENRLLPSDKAAFGEQLRHGVVEAPCGNGVLDLSIEQDHVRIRWSSAKADPDHVDRRSADIIYSNLIVSPGLMLLGLNLREFYLYVKGRYRRMAVISPRGRKQWHVMATERLNGSEILSVWLSEIQNAVNDEHVSDWPWFTLNLWLANRFDLAFIAPAGKSAEHIAKWIVTKVDLWIDLLRDTERGRGCFSS